jgi:hypothetical protein
MARRRVIAGEADAIDDRCEAGALPCVGDID